MTDRSSDITDTEYRNREFIVLLGKHEPQIAACVHALVPSWQDAEDILQETRLKLWQEFVTFQLGSDFLAWARTIARYAVRTHVKQCQRKPLILSNDVGDLVMTKLSTSPHRSEQKLEILADCVRKLSTDALDLLMRCYVDRQKIKIVAIELGRRLAGTYSALSRIRCELLECMRNGMRQEEKR